MAVALCRARAYAPASRTASIARRIAVPSLLRAASQVVPAPGPASHLRPPQARVDDGAGAGQRRGGPEPWPRRDARPGPLRRTRLQPRGGRQAGRDPHQRQEEAPRAPRARRPADPRRRRARASACSTSRSTGHPAAGPPSIERRPRIAISETQLHVTSQQLAGLRKLYEFSEKLMTMKEHRPAARGDARRGHRGHGRREGAHPARTTTRSRPTARDPDAAAPSPSRRRSARRRLLRPAARIRASRNVKREAIADASGRHQRQHRAQACSRRGAPSS